MPVPVCHRYTHPHACSCTTANAANMSKSGAECQQESNFLAHRAQCLRGNDKQAALLQTAARKDKQQRLTQSAETRSNSIQPEAMLAKKH